MTPSTAQMQEPPAQVLRALGAALTNRPGLEVLISDHQRRQCPGDCKDCSGGARGNRHVGEEGEGMGEEPERRYDRDTWKNTVNPGREGHFRMEGPEAGLQHVLCRAAGAEGRRSRGAAQARRSSFPSLTSSLLPPPHLLNSHTHLHIHTYMSNTHSFHSCSHPFFFFVPSLLSSVFHSHPPLVPWSGLSLSSLCPASFLLSFPYTTPCFGLLGKFCLPFLLPNCIHRLRDGASWSRRRLGGHGPTTH